MTEGQDDQRIKAWARQFEFKPLTFAPVRAVSEIYQEMTDAGKELFQLLQGPGGSGPTAERWPPATVEAVRSSSSATRREALTAWTGVVHEWTHALDACFSTFGATFAARAALECIDFLRDCPMIVEHLEAEKSFDPVFGFLPHADRAHVRYGLNAMHARSTWLGAVRGNSSVTIRGLGSERRNFTLLGIPLEPVYINDVMLTVRMEDGTYLRPLALLEARAIAVSSLNLLARLGGDDAAAAVVVDHLRWLYSPARAYPDYLFLLRLLRSLNGVDMEDPQTIVSGDELRVTLQSLSLISWYALNGATMSTLPKTPVVGPTERLIAVVTQLQDQLAAPDLKEIDVEKLYERADRLFAVDDPNFDNEVFVTTALEYVRSADGRVGREIGGSAIATHFQRVLGIHRAGLLQRQSFGYVASDALALDGDLMRYAGMADDDLQLQLSLEYEVDPLVTRYFRARENLLMRQSRPLGVWDDYWTTIESLTPDVAPDEARAAAVEASAQRHEVFRRAGSLAPGLVVPTGKMAGFRVFSIPRDWCPELFHGETTVTTTWLVFDAPGTVFVGLMLAVDGYEPINTLWHPVTDIEALQQTLAAEAIAVIPADALDDAEPDWKQVVRVPAVADPSHMIDRLRQLGDDAMASSSNEEAQESPSELP